MSSNAALKAELCEGRTISGTLYFKLTPKEPQPTGHTDMARAIGKGLVNEALALLRLAAEKEGFEVEIKDTIWVY